MNATTEERPLIHPTDIAGMYILPGSDSSASGWVTPPELDDVETGSASAAMFHSIVTWLRNGEIIRNLVADWESALDLHAGPDHFECRFFEYSSESSTSILVDYTDPVEVRESDFDPEYQQVVDELQSGGREIPAEDLIEMLRNIRDDPEEPGIKLFSLQAMARFLIKHRKFDDPIIGPDPISIMQVEWHIVGDGLLVMAFLDDNQIHCVAQADATPKNEALNRSVQLTENQAIEEFGHLVPLR